MKYHEYVSLKQKSSSTKKHIHVWDLDIEEDEELLKNLSHK